MTSSARQAPRERGHLFVPHRWHRPKILKWLRRTHAWLGLWGAMLGLLFGGTGILLNHRATMKIPAVKTQESTVQLPLPTPRPDDAKALSVWLSGQLGLDGKTAIVKVEPARPVGWGDLSLRQPERWQINVATPQQVVQAEYWRGNAFVSVKRTENNLFGVLTKLHMATGASAAWILLADTLAGGLIVLALTGLLLWTRLHGPRVLALGLCLTSLSLGILFALRAM